MEQESSQNAGRYRIYEIVHKTESLTYTMPPHTHEDIEIYLNLTDLPNVLLDNRMYSFSKGTLLVIPPNCIHKVISTGAAYERYILTINAEWLKNFLSAEGDGERYAYFFDPRHPMVISLDDRQTALLKGKLTALRNAKKDEPFKTYQLFFQTLEWLDGLVGTVEKDSDENEVSKLSGTAATVSKMISYIDEHLAENITTEDIAKELYLNHDYAARIFKRHVNTTVKHFVTLQRMILAKRLLVEGHSISDTYAMVGYNSYEHFSRVFKKMTGVTPGEYRKNPRNESVNESGNGFV